MNHDHEHDSNRSCCPPARRHRRGFGAVIVGLCLLTIGVLLTLDNFDLVDAENYLQYWPVVFVFVGLSHLMRPAQSRQTVAGLIWISIGSLLLLDRMGYIGFDLWNLWPIALILIGLSILLRGFRRKRLRQLSDDSSTFSATAVMGSDVRRITADNFQGGEATAVMGGCEIDLRDAGSAGEPAVIDCFAMWGGIEIWVPEDWEVEFDGTAIMAGFEDKTRRVGTTAAKRLIITGTAIMAGIEIKN